MLECGGAFPPQSDTRLNDRCFMSEREWEQFYTLLSKITDGDGAWEEKKATVLEKAKANDADSQLEEFVGWFHGSTEAVPA